jgi:adenylate kinase family enzyme
MSNYEDKYLKYKSKYLELKNNNTDMIGGGKDNKFILVDGTSSSGKTTICKFFSKGSFLLFQIDNYFNDKRLDYGKLFKKIKNAYGESDNIINNEPVKYMVNDAIAKHKNIVFDHISQGNYSVYEVKKIKIIYY